MRQRGFLAGTMWRLLTLFASCSALMVVATNEAKVTAAPSTSSDVISMHNESTTIHQSVYSTRQRGKLTRLPLVSLACLVAAVTAAFVVLQCHKALQSKNSSNTYGVNMRRLAKGGSEGSGSCSVSLGYQQHHISAVHCIGRDHRRSNFVNDGRYVGNRSILRVNRIMSYHEDILPRCNSIACPFDRR